MAAAAHEPNPLFGEAYVGRAIERMGGAEAVRNDLRRGFPNSRNGCAKCAPG